MAVIPSLEESFGASLGAERARLVRFCARFTGNSWVAEDLAQETLFEAWRSRAKLLDLGDIAPWLMAIARNVCLRWQRAQGREQRLYTGAHKASAAPESADAKLPDPLEQATASEDELSFTLERRELADLLGRAMALLPAETHAALVASYLDELPQQELAARLGLSDGALRARVHRGRQMLRRVFEEDLRADALTWGLLADNEPRWRETRIWCPFCGDHPLAWILDRESGAFSFRCAGMCQPGIGSVVGGHGPRQDALATLASPKAMLSRQCLELGVTYRSMMAGATRRCPQCDLPARIYHVQTDDDGSPPIMVHGVFVVCPHCGPIDGAAPWHLALDTPQAIQFWRRHPRIRALPIQTLDYGGRPAVRTGFESRSGHARLEVITARDTLEVLHTAAAG